MTREYYYNLFEDRDVSYSGHVEFHDDIVNEIFDDFESRVCGECRHYVPMKWTDFDNKCASMENKVSHVDKDFGCNQFVRKEEEL